MKILKSEQQIIGTISPEKVTKDSKMGSAKGVVQVAGPLIEWSSASLERN